MNTKQILFLVVVVLAAGATGFFVSPYVRSWREAEKSQPVEEGATPVIETVETQEPRAGKDYSGGTEVPQALRSVRDVLATRLALSADTVLIIEAAEKEWPNSCLGLARQGEMCLQVMTPGYEVLLQAEGKDYTYRTNTDGTLVRADSGSSK